MEQSSTQLTSSELEESNGESNIERMIRPIRKAAKIRSDYDIATIQEGTKSIPFFAKYIAEGKKDLHYKCCKYMSYEAFESGQLVFSAGERGTKFYIILEGKVGVYVKVKNEMKKVKELEQGDSFGELALVNDQPRSASIKCEKSCHFAVLDKRYYMMLFEQITNEDIKKQLGFYTQIELFSSWNYNKLKVLYIKSFRIHVSKGDMIIAESDQIDAIYIVVSGEFVATKKSRVDQDDEKGVRHELKAQKRYLQSQQQAKQLFILTEHEIFGQETIGEEQSEGGGVQTFQYSVGCASQEGVLIYIKLQDYYNIILKDPVQREYMVQYSKRRLNRINERIQEISNALLPMNSQSHTNNHAHLAKSYTKKQSQEFESSLSFGQSQSSQQQQSQQLSQQQQSSSLQSQQSSLQQQQQQSHLQLQVNNINRITRQMSSSTNPLDAANVGSSSNIGGSQNYIQPFSQGDLTAQSKEYQGITPSRMGQGQKSRQDFEQITSIFSFQDAAVKLGGGGVTAAATSSSLSGSKSELFTRSPFVQLKTQSSGVRMVSQGSFVGSPYLEQQQSIQQVRTLKASESLSFIEQENTSGNQTQFVSPPGSTYRNLIRPQSSFSGMNELESDEILEENHRGVEQPRSPLKKRSMFEKNSSSKQQELHPLVLGFHEQLKIRFYNKFKNGQIEDLKSHLSSYMPIQSLHVGENVEPNSAHHVSAVSASSTIGKNPRDIRLKEIRAYEQRLMKMIQSDQRVSAKSLSPLTKHTSKPIVKESLNSSIGQQFKQQLQLQQQQQQQQIVNNNYYNNNTVQKPQKVQEREYSCEDQSKQSDSTGNNNIPKLQRIEKKLHIKSSTSFFLPYYADPAAVSRNYLVEDTTVSPIKKNRSFVIGSSSQSGFLGKKLVSSQVANVADAKNSIQHTPGRSGSKAGLSQLQKLNRICINQNLSKVSNNSSCSVLEENTKAAFVSSRIGFKGTKGFNCSLYQLFKDKVTQNNQSAMMAVAQSQIQPFSLKQTS